MMLIRRVYLHQGLDVLVSVSGQKVIELGRCARSGSLVRFKVAGSLVDL